MDPFLRIRSRAARESPTSLIYRAKTHSSQCYGRWQVSVTQRGRERRWHCTESEVEQEQRAANKARDRGNRAI